MRKLVEFDDETWNALVLLGKDRMATLQDLSDEAFADLLKKHHRPLDLRKALRDSAKASARSTNRADATEAENKTKPLKSRKTKTRVAKSATRADRR
jgi:hypothetical protein